MVWDFCFVLEDVDGAAVGFEAEGVRVWACHGGGFFLACGCGSADGGFYDVLVDDNEEEDGNVQVHNVYQPL